ncbi:MAG: transcriptional repressor [Lachnospiraceae bacterium]|nr:transcriptional repressor [Lachnospiraceae bacterium]
MAKMVTNMQKDIIVQRLRDRGCRITKQRLMLLDVILEEECSSCKEIFYKASKIDKTIGSATVYRMINTLEDIGAISRKNMYRIACGTETCAEKACTVTFEDGTILELSGAEWNKVIKSGLAAEGYKEGCRLVSVDARSCDCAG